MDTQKMFFKGGRMGEMKGGKREGGKKEDRMGEFP